jgi:hypothetical protein
LVAAFFAAGFFAAAFVVDFAAGFLTSAISIFLLNLSLANIPQAESVPFVAPLILEMGSFAFESRGKAAIKAVQWIARSRSSR